MRIGINNENLPLIKERIDEMLVAALLQEAHNPSVAVKFLERFNPDQVLLLQVSIFGLEPQRSVGKLDEVVLFG
jgi:hypothetical protein